MKRLCAGVAELVDAPDSKSGDGDIVSVRLRPSVPLRIFKTVLNGSQQHIYHYNVASIERINT